MKQRRFSTLVLLIASFAFTFGCSGAGGAVKLCDYKHIEIPTELLVITEEDVKSAVSVDMFMFNVLVPKPYNADVVEEGDTVKVLVAIGDNEAQEYDMIAGSSAFGEFFAERMMGKRVGEPFTFSVNEEVGQAVVLSVSMFAQTITDEIARQYYNCGSVAEAIQSVKAAIAEARIFDAVYPEIVNNSMIRGYEKERSAYADSALRALAYEAEREGYSDGEIEAYLKEEMDTTVTDYRQSMESFYDVYLIMCELMKQEGVHVTEEEFSAFCEKEYGDMYDSAIPEEKLFGPMGKEYAMYNLYYYERCPKTLIKYYQHLFQQ